MLSSNGNQLPVKWASDYQSTAAPTWATSCTCVTDRTPVAHAFEALEAGPRPHQPLLAQSHGLEAGTLGEAQLHPTAP